jgi:hypothetical protein
MRSTEAGSWVSRQQQKCHGLLKGYEGWVVIVQEESKTVVLSGRTGYNINRNVENGSEGPALYNKRLCIGMLEE